jgi:signal transduction histidine kinase
MTVQPADALRMFAGDAAERYLAFTQQAMASGTSQRAELEISTDDTVRTYDFRIEPRHDPAAFGITAVGFDITPSKQAEASLLESDRRKDEFLATLSHELRNPLTPLSVAFEVARVASHDSVKLAKAFAIMDHQLQVLRRLVDDLLDVSRITHGKIRLDTASIDPAIAIAAAVETVQSLIDEAHHQVRVEAAPSTVFVHGDLVRLTQVITNLLTNAVKYSPDGSHITVSLDVDRDRDKAVIRVIDDGNGIAPDLLPVVFDIFVQSRDDEGRARGGLGVGLHLVRRIVEMHHGTVSVASGGLGKGSTFAIELPIAGKAE